MDPVAAGVLAQVAGFGVGGLVTDPLRARASLL